MKSQALLIRTLCWLLWRGRLPLLVSVAVLTALLAVPASHVAIEQDNASMSSRDPQSQATYLEFKKAFGDDNLILIGLRYPQLLAPEGIALLQKLTERIAANPQVDAVYSLSNAHVPILGPYGIEISPLLPSAPSEEGFAKRLDSVLRQNPDQTGRLLSADRKTAALLVQPKLISGSAWQGLITELRFLRTLLPTDAELYLSGVPVQKADVARTIQHDQKVLIPLSILLLSGLLALIFRRLSGVLLPLLVMGISLTWTIGIYSLAGLSLNTITALLPPVVMVLAVATTVHIYNAWLELCGECGEPRTLLAHRTAELFVPCLLTALTTAIGLASLAACDIPAVRNFGLFASFGVLCAFAVAITLVPVLLSYLPIPPPSDRWPSQALRNVLRLQIRLVFRRPWQILVTTLALTAAALPALGHIDNNTDLIRFFSEDSPLYRDTMALDHDLGGVETLEMVIRSSDDSSLLHASVVRQLSEWEAKVRSRPEVSGTFSLLDLIRPLQHVRSDPNASAVPATDIELFELYDLLLAAGEPQLIGRVLTEDRKKLRLSIQLHAIGSAQTAKLAESLLAEGRHRFGNRFILVATGNYLQLSNDSNRLVDNLLHSFLLSFALIVLALWVAFRSWSLLCAALAPNLMPLVWTGGLMGWAGIQLSTGTAMIAAVSIGLVVDDTIHYLHRFQREYTGYSRPALVRATLGVGPALIISTIVLTCGFWVGAFGSFRPTVYFSVLTGVTLLGALLCDLLVLPASLLVLAGKIRIKADLAITMIMTVGLFSLSAPAHAELAQPVPLATPRHDLLVRWVEIPKNPPHVGMLRLLKRDDAVVLQTDLETTILHRVFAGIKDREQQRWQTGSVERADMGRYLALLEQAVAQIEQRVLRRSSDQDRLRRLQIEFIADPPRYDIMLLTREPGGAWEAFPPLAVSSRYLYGDMLTIMAGNLVETQAEAVAVLRPLLSPETRLPEMRP